MKKQIILIHGGDTFNSYKKYLKFLKNKEIDFKRHKDGKSDWKNGLAVKLGPSFEVISPSMPNKTNAKYLEWKIWFEKFIPHLNQDVRLAGHSLGGTFLAKYLSENYFSKTILATFLIAPTYGAHSHKSTTGKNWDFPHPLGDFRLSENLEKLSRQGGKIFIYGSENDPIVPVSDFQKYAEKIKGSVFRKFTDRGHFNDEEFPELITDIKNS